MFFNASVPRQLAVTERMLNPGLQQKPLMSGLQSVKRKHTTIPELMLLCREKVPEPATADTHRYLIFFFRSNNQTVSS